MPETPPTSVMPDEDRRLRAVVMAVEPVWRRDIGVDTVMAPAVASPIWSIELVMLFISSLVRANPVLPLVPRLIAVAAL